MYVSPDTLAMHLRVLKQHFTLIDLGEWLSLRAAGGALPDRACCITFDDGWRDNYEYGLPVLAAAQVPATVFLVTDFIGSTLPVLAKPVGRSCWAGWMSDMRPAAR